MFKKLIAVGALALSMVTSANAATIALDDFGIIETIGDSTQSFFTSADHTAMTLSTRWDSGATNDLRAYIDFSVDTMFDLTLDLKVGSPGNSAFRFDEYIGGSLSSIQGTQQLPAAGDTLFSSLSAGSYRFTFIENNNNPASGGFVLGITPVPVPGAGILLGSVLAGAAAMRFRKKKLAA